MMVTLAFNELNKIHLVSNLGTMVVRINIQIKIPELTLNLFSHLALVFLLLTLNMELPAGKCDLFLKNVE